MRQRALRLALSVSLSLTALGCASFGGEPKTYTDQAERAFDEADSAFSAGDYLESIRRFNLIRTKYPYSQYARLSDLKIADAYFAQEKYATAVEQYRTFAKLYPEHPQVTYAKWRVALSFYEQMPKDWFALPPGYERDLARAKDAQREMRFFLRRNKDTQYGPDGERKLLLVRRRLADHEFYVASFYIKRGNPRAAALRLTGMLKDYSGLGLDAQALFLLARAYIELGDVDKASLALSDLIEYHPSDPLAAQARDYVSTHAISRPESAPPK